MFKDLIAESTEVEFKSELERAKPKSWVKTVDAFANGSGGALIFGIDDDTHQVIGIADPQSDIEFIGKAIEARIDPIPKIAIEAVQENDNWLIVLTVPEGNEPPYYYKADGEYRAYVRHGNETIPTSPHQLKQLVLKGSKLSFDSLETNYDLNKYSFDALKATYYERLKIPFEDSDFVSFGLATEAGKLTNAGVLFADQWILRQNRIFCTRWNGLHKAHQKKDVLDDHEYEGSILWLLRNGLAFIEQNNITGWTKTYDNRIEEPSYARRACEEALVNALIHRDYLFPGSEVTIFIYDDRLEITSPGSKVDGRLPEDIDVYRVSSVRRNPIIADLFQRMGFMEKRGSGLRKIREETSWCANYKEELMPQFLDDGRQFTVVLWNMNYATGQVSDQVSANVSANVGANVGKSGHGSMALNIQAVLEIIGDSEHSAQELMNKLGLSHRGYFIKHYLKPAMEAGLLERTNPDKPRSVLQKYRRPVNLRK